MKKILSILLALSILFSLCACSSMKEEEEEEETRRRATKVQETEPPTDTEPEETEPEETEPEETEPEETEPEETEPKETEPERTEPKETEPKPTEPEKITSGFQMGVVNRQTYESVMLGMGCQLNRDWTYCDEQELAELSGFASDQLGEGYQAMLENATVIYDMAAERDDGLCNINITFEKASPVLLNSLDVEQNLQNMIPLTKLVCANMGYSDPSCQVMSVKLDGQQFYYMYTTATYLTMNVYVMSIQIPCDGYLANITITSFWEDSTMETFECFYVLD